MPRFSMHDSPRAPAENGAAAGSAARTAAELLELRQPDALTAVARRQPLPSRHTVIALAEELRALLFPGYLSPGGAAGQAALQDSVAGVLQRIERDLAEQLKRGMCFECSTEDCLRDCAAAARQTAQQFIQRLPEVARLLAADARAAYDGDPACVSPHEPVLCYPGLLAVTYYRLAHVLFALGAPLIPRLLTEHAHSVTGIDIHPGARIGRSFFIDHGTGVVIGETCSIGERVKLYQGVTLGAKSFALDAQGRPVKGIPRHPIVEDDVTIYSGATILGRVTIGAGSVIGGNVWLTRDVPAGSIVLQQSAQQERFSSGSGI